MTDLPIHHAGVGPNGEIVEINDPGSTGHLIDKVFVIVSEDENGEGVVAARSKDGWIPMVSSDERVINMYAEIAKSMAEVSGKTIRMIELSTRREVRVIHDAEQA